MKHQDRVSGRKALPKRFSEKCRFDPVTFQNLPALEELIDKVSVKDIFDEVESVFGKEAALGRNVKMFLCQRYTGEKLKDIGAYSGVGESIKSEFLGDMTRFSFIKSGSCPQTMKLKKDKALRKKVAGIMSYVKG